MSTVGVKKVEIDTIKQKQARADSPKGWRPCPSREPGRSQSVGLPRELGSIGPWYQPSHLLTRPRRDGQAAGPWIPPHCHLPLPKWLDTAADESAEEVPACQPISEQTLEVVTHGLQLAGIFLSYPVPPAGLDGGVLTRNHRERRSSIVPQEEPLILPYNQ
jgi:hypothetical protein